MYSFCFSFFCGAIRLDAGGFITDYWIGWVGLLDLCLCLRRGLGAGEIVGYRSSYTKRVDRDTYDLLFLLGGQ